MDRAAARPILCLVTQRRGAGDGLRAAVAAAVAAGVDWVQVREREMGGAELLAHVEGIAGAARASRAGARVVVNRRLDVALAAGADGVHLGFDAVPAPAARALLGPGALVGASLHDPAELTPELVRELSYAHLAPVFPPFSKASGRPALGLGALRRAAAAGLPVLAQGGIDPERAAACVAAGAAGVAVTGAILDAPDPGAAAAALRAALDR
jgi:thiamine-phosphate pyrophosphorylase